MIKIFKQEKILQAEAYFHEMIDINIYNHSFIKQNSENTLHLIKEGKTLRFKLSTER